MKVLAAVILLSINLSVIDGAAFIPRGGKIVGGVEIDLKLAPYQVSLLYRSYHTCGGELNSVERDQNVNWLTGRLLLRKVQLFQPTSS